MTIIDEPYDAPQISDEAWCELLDACSLWSKMERKPLPTINVNGWPVVLKCPQVRHKD